MISVLRSWKGHATFLEAAANCSATRNESAFHHRRGWARARGMDAIHQAGAVEGQRDLIGHRADVPQVLASLDVLVLPSYAHEGIPQIILQAQGDGAARGGDDDRGDSRSGGGWRDGAAHRAKGCRGTWPKKSAQFWMMVSWQNDSAGPPARISRRATAWMRWGRGCWPCTRRVAIERTDKTYLTYASYKSHRRRIVDYRRAMITPKRNPMPAAIATDCHGLLSINSWVL